MKCYIWETPSGIYDISRDKRPGTQCVECSKEDIQDLIDIPMWAMCKIQQKINYILYKQQPELNYDNWKRDTDNV